MDEEEAELEEASELDETIASEDETEEELGELSAGKEQPAAKNKIASERDKRRNRLFFMFYIMLNPSKRIITPKACRAAPPKRSLAAYRPLRKPLIRFPKNKPPREIKKAQRAMTAQAA